jgi:hypothetical protein
VRRELAIGQRKVTINVAEPIAKAVAEVGYDLMCGVTVLARITSILDECDGCGCVAQNVIAFRIDRMFQFIQVASPC